MEYGKKVNYLGRDGQERMLKNGWRLEIAENMTEEHSADALYERLLNKGYAKIKIYYDTTCIRGLHCYFAMVK